MNVALLGPYPPPHGGVQTNIVAIRRLLQDCGHRCTVVNLTRFRKPDAGGVYSPTSALGVLRLLLREQFDVIHIHIGGSVTLRLLLLALFCSFVPWSRTVLTFHSGGYPSSKEGKAASRATLRGFVFRRLDAIIAVNESLVDLFESFGVASQRIHLIAPHAVGAENPATLPPHLRKFFEDHEPSLLTVGGLEPEYDLALQLSVLPLLIQCFPRVGLAIIGTGSLHDEIATRVREHPSADRILLCGDVAHAATLTAIARCSVLLRTTWYDGDSIAVREALHYGTPVIATDNGMRPRGVHLFPVSDAEELHRVLYTVLAAPRPPAITPSADEGNVEAVLRLYASLSRSKSDQGIRNAGAAKGA